MSYANSQDWIAYKQGKVNIIEYKVIDTLFVKIDSAKNKNVLNNKFYYIDIRGKSKSINFDKVVSYRMNNNIKVLKEYTVVYKDRHILLTNENTPIYNNVSYVIDNLTGKFSDKVEENKLTEKIKNDTAKTAVDKNTANDLNLILYKINKLESSVNDINLHLEKHHAEFKNGVIISICGIGSTVAGVVLIYKGMTSTTRTRHNFNSTTNTTTNNKSGRGSSSASTGIGVTFTSLGAIMTGIGCVIMIDSDKWFSQKRSHIY